MFDITTLTDSGFPMLKIGHGDRGMSFRRIGDLFMTQLLGVIETLCLMCGCVLVAVQTKPKESMQVM